MSQTQILGFPVDTRLLNITNSKVDFNGTPTDLVDVVATLEESSDITAVTAAYTAADVVVAAGAASALSTAVPLTTRGDLLTRGASANARLARGTSGYLLSNDGTDVAWRAPLFISVKDPAYGAVGNGSTDDTAAFTGALAALTVGGVLIVPPGTYKITSQIVIPEGVTIWGAGRRSVASPPTAQLITSSITGATAAITAASGSDITIRDLYVSGRASGSGNEIDFTGNSRRIRIENVTVNTSTTGAGIALGTGGYCIQSEVSGCTVVGAAIGFISSASCTSITWRQNYANNCTSVGYFIKGTYHALIACAADGNTLYGYTLDTAYGVGMVGCGAESSGRSALSFSTAENIAIVGFRSHLNNTAASASNSSFATINDSSTKITIIGGVDTSPNAATVNSVNSVSGSVGEDIDIRGTFTLPFSSAITAKEVRQNASWAVLQFDGTAGSPSIVAGRNATSITKNATGDYTITVRSPAQTRTLMAVGSAAGAGGAAISVGQVASTSNTVRIRTYNGNTGALTDSALINVSIDAV